MSDALHAALRDDLTADIEAAFEFLGDDPRPSSLAAYLLLPNKTISKAIRRMKMLAHDGGWEAAEVYRDVSAEIDWATVYEPEDGAADICATGVGGGEICMRRKGHDGDHDPDSTEVSL